MYFLFISVLDSWYLVHVDVLRIKTLTSVIVVYRVCTAICSNIQMRNNWYLWLLELLLHLGNLFDQECLGIEKQQNNLNSELNKYLWKKNM